MQCLNKSQIATWLRENNSTPAPYGQSRSPTYCLQFACPKQPLANASFLRQFLCLASREILIHVTDWPTYEPSEMAIIDSLRESNGELRNLIDAPGHLIPTDNHELAIALFGHTMNFDWNAYLYFPDDLATIYNWEGELIDFWTNDSTMQLSLIELITRYELG